jgi:hypothetical protein
MNDLRAVSFVALLGVVLPGPAAFAHSLPLGDGKVSTSPKKGYVYSCSQDFSRNVGAHASGDWINESAGTWDPERKPVVDGAVRWSGEISMATGNATRVIRGNGLPMAHTTGEYPISSADDAYQYDRNPNAISEQTIQLSIPLVPEMASQPSCVPMGMVAIAISGVPIFNAIDERGDDAPAHEIQDTCNGHPQQSGQYHYHNLSSCLTDTRSGPNGTSDLLGYSLDGFGIYGMYENGEKLTTSDLDECHGRTSTVMWNGEPVNMYHYVFTEDYPYSIGCFKGTVDPSLVQATGGRSGNVTQQQPRSQPQDKKPPRRN